MKKVSYQLSKSLPEFSRKTVFSMFPQEPELKIRLLWRNQRKGEIVVNYHSAAKLRLLLEIAGFKITGISVEPDDFGRPFDYCYIFARNFNGKKLDENKYFQLDSGNGVDIFVCSDGAARI